MSRRVASVAVAASLIVTLPLGALTSAIASDPQQPMESAMQRGTVTVADAQERSVPHPVAPIVASGKPDGVFAAPPTTAVPDAPVVYLPPEQWTGIIEGSEAPVAYLEGASPVPDGAAGGDVIPDRYIVTFDRAAMPEDDLRTLETVGAEVVPGTDQMVTDEAGMRLAATMGGVQWIEPDRVVVAEADQVLAPWALDRIDQRELPLNRLYSYTTGATVPNVYVVDTGIRTTHGQFAGRAVQVATTVNDGRGAGDCHGHGTHVAGIIGSSTYGVAKNARLYAVRVMDCKGSGSTSGVIAGLNWIANNARRPAVINLSVGGKPSAALDAAVDAVVARGLTVVVAAGNGNASACDVSPARVPASITVAAIDGADNRASFSNYGSCVDVFAPGVAVVSTYYTSDSATASMSGTSMAAPAVAGAVAAHLSRTPTATPAAVAAALSANATVGAVRNAGAGSPDKLLYVTP